MRTAFIGGGVMGEAMVRGMLAKGVAEPEAIVVSDVSAERLSKLKRDYGLHTGQDNRQALQGSHLVVLAVKPQDLGPLLEELSGAFHPDQLVLSIIAGATVATVAEGLKHGAVVRAMPNTPAQIGEGITVWTASSEVSPSQKDTARSVLATLGSEVFVTDERLIDMATAVSGSGPAYFFLVMEALTDAAMDIGLPREIAEKLVSHTALGASRLVQETGEHPGALRKMVTSKGGTTERGLHQLEEGGLRTLIARAIAAAYERAKELGG